MLSMIIMLNKQSKQKMFINRKKLKCVLIDYGDIQARSSANAEGPCEHTIS